MKNLNFILADPFLEGISGHHYAYLNSIKVELASRQFKAVIIGNKNADNHFDADEIVPLFNTIQPIKRKKAGTILNKITSFLGMRKNNRSHNIEKNFYRTFSEDLLLLKKYFDNDASNHILFDSFKAEHLKVLVDCIIQNKIPYKNIKYVVVLHFTADLDGRDDYFYKKTYAAAFELVEKHNLQNILHIITDTDLLSAEFMGITSLSIPVFPIPHIRSTPELKYSRDEIQISFLGPARREKGFHHTAEIAKFINKRKFSKYHVKLQVQTYSAGKLGSRHLKICRQLKKYGAHLIERPLSDFEYSNTLSKTSIFPMPYSIRPYHRQSSGVFAEALGHGAICIAPLGTWMSSELTKLDLGVIYDPSKKGGLIDALKYTIDNFETLSDEYRSIQSSWNKFHNSKTYVDLLFQLIS